jgi:hypothetical protein
MSGYMAERRVWNTLRESISHEAQQEYELAASTLIERYNTTLFENRFIAGGGVEMLTYALLRSVGIGCHAYSDQATGGDLMLPTGQKISIKGSFKGGPQSIKLMNKMGSGKREWETATLFVVSGVGIVYGDPDMVDDAHIKDVSDGLQLHRRGLVALISDPVNLIRMDISCKPGSELTGASLKASNSITVGILQEMQSTVLLPELPKP